MIAWVLHQHNNNNNRKQLIQQYHGLNVCGNGGVRVKDDIISDTPMSPPLFLKTYTTTKVPSLYVGCSSYVSRFVSFPRMNVPFYFLF
jgi:hypothetical protein